MESNNQFKNGTIVLVLGIVAIVFALLSCCAGVFTMIPGLICAVVAMVMASKEVKGAQALGHDPQSYSNYSNIKTGKLLSIISLVVYILLILMIVVAYFAFGTLDPEALQEILEDMQNQ